MKLPNRPTEPAGRTAEQRAVTVQSSATRPPVVLTIGKFDGVHAGHRHVLAYLAEAAAECEATSAVLVLHPDPVSVLAGQAVGRLTTLAERIERLRGLGVGIVEPLMFSREVAQLDPELFMGQLADRFELRAVVAGSDFAFGYNRVGTLDWLRRTGHSRGFRVVEAPPLIVHGGRVSSRRLRAAIAAGDIALARTLLRCPPRFRGTVVHGTGRGRQLGYPTANIDPDEHAVLPANGVYVVRVEGLPAEHDHGAAEGVLSIGVRPTFGHGPRVLEVHLLDYQGDLYGCQLSIQILARLRGEERFPDARALVAQLSDDVAQARRCLADEAAPRWELASTGLHNELMVRGFDFAELCESAALGLGAALPSRAGEQSVRAERVELLGQEEELWQAWLARVSELTAPPARVTVYQAGEGQLHALWLPSTPSGSTPVRLQGVAGPRQVSDWLWEARLRYAL